MVKVEAPDHKGPGYKNHCSTRIS
uniref:Uncharacterized protein n=1 Tax=Rhizophora mucronata TaxID=61149 RepID=A0A2P2IJ55_RHIMU